MDGYSHVGGTVAGGFAGHGGGRGGQAGPGPLATPGLVLIQHPRQFAALEPPPLLPGGRRSLHDGLQAAGPGGAPGGGHGICII